MDLLASIFNKKLDRFIPSSRDPGAFAVNALVTSWNPFYLNYTFLNFQLLPGLLHSIEKECIPVIPIALNRPRRMFVI